MGSFFLMVYAPNNPIILITTASTHAVGLFARETLIQYKKKL